MSWLNRNPVERGIRTVKGPGFVHGELPNDQVFEPVPLSPIRRDTSISGRILVFALQTIVAVVVVGDNLRRQITTPRIQRRAPLN